MSGSQRAQAIHTADFSGRLYARATTAIALSCVLPMMVTTYILRTHVAPALELRDGAGFVLLHLVASAVLLAVLAGAYVIRDIGRTVACLGDLVSGGDGGRYATRRGGDIGTLQQSLASALARVHEQAEILRGFTTRLDTAQGELEQARGALAAFHEAEASGRTIGTSRVPATVLLSLV